MTEQHPSSKQTITREQYDELVGAGLVDWQTTVLSNMGSAALEFARARAAMSAPTEATADAMSRLGEALAAPHDRLNPRGITYTNRAARRQQARKGRP